MAHRSDQADTLLRTTFAGATGLSAQAAQQPCYLAVFEEQEQFLFPLPQKGEVVIGRGEEAVVRIRDPQASRRHASLTLRGETIELRDLGSQNGTRLGGVKLGEPRTLLSGDVIEIGATALVLHCPRRIETVTRQMTLEALRAWLEVDLQRAAALGESEQVVSLSLEPTKLASLQAQAAKFPFRVWCEDPGSGLLGVLNRDTASEEGLTELTGELGTLGLEVRVGIAQYPTHAQEADALLLAARQASANCPVGGIAGAEPRERRIALGEEEALVADSAMLRVYELLERLARSDLAVLILGETGTGKEYAARALHAFSHRSNSPFVALNCAALTETLVESELFGHEKGAFTGAVARKQGLLEAAQGGTVFLDEVAELPAPTQAKLLRALDTRRITRVGDVTERPIDVRVVAATNRDLGAAVQAGHFRKDLCFRLSGGVVWIPPLRHRPREIGLLSQRFYNQACERLGKPASALPAPTIARLAEHGWPGNVRELKNVVEYCAAAWAGSRLDPWQISDRLALDPIAGLSGAQQETSEQAQAPEPSPERSGFKPLEQEVAQLECDRITAALKATAGNQTRAAALLSMPLRTFINKMNRYGLR